MKRFRLWLRWTFREPYAQFNPVWLAETETLSAEVEAQGDPYVGA